MVAMDGSNRSKVVQWVWKQHTNHFVCAFTVHSQSLYHPISIYNVRYFASPVAQAPANSHCLSDGQAFLIICIFGRWIKSDKIIEASNGECCERLIRSQICHHFGDMSGRCSVFILHETICGRVIKVARFLNRSRSIFIEANSTNSVLELPPETRAMTWTWCCFFQLFNSY